MHLPASRTGPWPPSDWRLVRKPLLLLGGLGAAVIVLGPAGAGFDAEAFDRLVGGRGVQGAVIFVLAGAAGCAVGLPRQIVAFAGSYAFGLWAGLALSLAAQIFGCAATLAWTRAIGRAGAVTRVGGRLARLEQFLAANPFTATLMLRLLPLGNNLIPNLLAGASAIPAGPFLLASLVGHIPQTLIFALLGAGFRVAEAMQIAVGLGLFAGSLLLGLLLLRRQRRLACSASTPWSRQDGRTQRRPDAPRPRPELRSQCSWR